MRLKKLALRGVGVLAKNEPAVSAKSSTDSTDSTDAKTATEAKTDEKAPSDC